MGRYKEYASDAERQRAYRQRKAQAEEQLRQRAREGGGKQAKRKAVSAKLIKVLGMLGSDHAGERDVAARKAMQILKEAGLTWYDVLDIDR